MDRLYEITIFLNIGFLAIVATVFVVAVSFLGHAVQQARDEESARERREREQFDRELAELQREIEEARKSGDVSGLVKKSQHTLSMTYD
jgi:uncharacterized membrane protein YhiD involved in acid resistance